MAGSFNCPFFDRISTPRPGRCGFLTAPDGLKKDVKSNNFLKLNDPEWKNGGLEEWKQLLIEVMRMLHSAFFPVILTHTKVWTILVSWALGFKSVSIFP